jgi:hypothetical protein
MKSAVSPASSGGAAQLRCRASTLRPGFVVADPAQHGLGPEEPSQRLAFKVAQVAQQHDVGGGERAAQGMRDQVGAVQSAPVPLLRQRRRPGPVGARLAAGHAGWLAVLGVEGRRRQPGLPFGAVPVGDDLPAGGAARAGLGGPVLVLGAAVPVGVAFGRERGRGGLGGWVG